MFELKKTFFLLSIFFLNSVTAYTQQNVSGNKLYQQVQTRIGTHTISKQKVYQLFRPVEYKASSRSEKTVRTPQYLSLEKNVVQELTVKEEELVRLELPYHSNKLILALFDELPVSDDFRVNSPSGVIAYDKTARHYRGVVEGDNHSVVAISVFKDQIVGMISSTNFGNMILGQIPEEGGTHILYQENEFSPKMPFECDAILPPHHQVLPVNGASARSSSDECIQIFFETSFSIYEKFKHSDDKVINFITGTFNQVAAIYASENIKLLLSDLFVWNQPDPYDHENTTSALESFISAPLKGNGNLRHLLDMADNRNGGRAYVDVICDKVLNVGYCNIVPFYDVFPTYNWTVNVIAHEIGHGLGSFHTQDCIWGPENCTAIDGCASSSPDVGCGTCDPAPIPEKGTLMSYCHLQNGIDFTLGLGEEPGDLIRTRIAAAACVTSCESVSNSICQLSIEGVEVKAATCGAENGFVKVNVSGASGSETFDIGNGPQGSNLFEGLIAGNYQVIVRDGLACSRTFEIAIEMESEAPELHILAMNPSCRGDDGSLQLQPDGGKLPYQFEFQGIISENPFYKELKAGEYLVGVVDGNGCKVSKQLSLFEDAAPQLDTNVRHTTCGLSNGSIELTGLGGSLPFQLDIKSKPEKGGLIDTSFLIEATSTLSDLPPGYYSIRMWDDQGCSDSLDLLVNGSKALSLDLVGQDASCKLSNGSIQINTSGGREPFRYFSNGIESSSPSLAGLDTGFYLVTIMDSDNCENSASIRIMDDRTFTSPELPSEVVICEGEGVVLNTNLEENSYVRWTFDGIVLPDTVTTLDVASSGKYSATVVYDANCKLTAETEVIQRKSPHVEVREEIQVCRGEQFQLTGINSHHNYLWSNGVSGPVNSFSASGTYFLRTVDEFGCINESKIDVSVIDPVTLSGETDIKICPGAEIQLMVSGADRYLWSSEDPGLWEVSVSDPFVAPEYPASYQVIGTNECSADTMILHVTFHKPKDLLLSDTVTLAGVPIDISLPGATQVKWSSAFDIECEDCNQTQIRANSSGNIYVSYVDENGCYWNDTTYIGVTDLVSILPEKINVITPNDDGINDLLSFEHLERFEAAVLNVYNQDGVVVFESPDYKNDWKGNSASGVLPEGIYFYTLTLRYHDNLIKLDSDLTILRD